MSNKNPTKFTPASSMRYMNGNAPSHDADVLKAKKIKSPDVSKNIRHYDPVSKTTTFFISQERYDLYMHRRQYPEVFLENVKKGGRRSNKQ